ncbi:ABC-type Fe3+-hydroxamate transport system, periplasmic component [Clostridium pasteurianum DSM 525 = ATCC 6013]|uniref:ABC-type Fe3+-hydroxamate transport system, periplasmic component n=1 Tax=Clostridium pasteurianum DSM 525 = ATCC 6013 TaxID=1262449 RepID=A0A0H3J6V5_CLOPA|nr:ABC transporter substrate-binding protein [Clostridium pasteurianum]AJA49641.1 ABC-type Fe3+-hydroxamate transport system, periplasmic component [Clostridium pasteurianum DSM 525 = ATCC 6013]AJA53629.1 ABC-type Fe3+-hydroxamate transport system, periplasmic component [Clostridium pasteurianum DSM 525 = ATCC 6013]AOZ76793.1 ABC transporter substrate-binding protein [Clostridium pasteurianum DSM 525 = ATCC 6013]AOZ80590.1 ABC transporter substrate-binding protein [Clostridium pasteurianum]ELP
MKNFKISIVLIICLIFTLLVGCSNNSSANNTTADTKPTKQTIIDMGGTKVGIPTKINAIADGWPAHNEVLVMLGHGNKIVATNKNTAPNAMPWLAVVNPQMNKASIAFTNTDVNTEELLKAKPDIAFVSNKSLVSKPTESGIPTVYVNFTDFNGLKDCFKLTAKILGSDAEKRSNNYIKYLDSKLDSIQSITSKIPESEKPKVLHVISLNPLTIDGSDTIIDSWIKVAGGINAASSVSGNQKVVSIEQVLQWNPDVIIFGSNIAKTVSERTTAINNLSKDSTWSKINAVKNKKLYVNPNGAFTWDRYSAEEALQIQWAAKTLYPDKFTNIDISKETKSFYKTFLNYNLTDDETSKIINAEPPVTNAK